MSGARQALTNQLRFITIHPLNNEGDLKKSTSGKVSQRIKMVSEINSDVAGSDQAVAERGCLSPSSKEGKVEFDVRGRFSMEQVVFKKIARGFALGAGVIGSAVILGMGLMSFSAVLMAAGGERIDVFGWAYQAGFWEAAGSIAGVAGLIGSAVAAAGGNRG